MKNVCSWFLTNNKDEKNIRKCKFGSFCQNYHLTQEEYKNIHSSIVFKCICTEDPLPVKLLIDSLGGCKLCGKKGYYSTQEITNLYDWKRAYCECKSKKSLLEEEIRNRYPSSKPLLSKSQVSWGDNLKKSTFISFHPKLSKEAYVCQDCNCIIKN